MTPECPDTSTSSNQNKKLLEGATTFDLCTARDVAAVREELVLAAHERRALGNETEEGGLRIDDVGWRNVFGAPSR